VLGWCSQAPLCARRGKRGCVLIYGGGAAKQVSQPTRTNRTDRQAHRQAKVGRSTKKSGDGEISKKRAGDHLGAETTLVIRQLLLGLRRNHLHGVVWTAAHRVAWCSRTPASLAPAETHPLEDEDVM
jgi:hypothetical protein